MSLLKCPFLWSQLMLQPTADRLRGDHVGDFVPPHDASNMGRSRAAIQLEVLALRHQLPVLQDTPIPRPITPPGDGAVVAIPMVGGLHHRYERRAA